MKRKTSELRWLDALRKREDLILLLTERLGLRLHLMGSAGWRRVLILSADKV